MESHNSSSSDEEQSDPWKYIEKKKAEEKKPEFKNRGHIIQTEYRKSILERAFGSPPPPPIISSTPHHGRLENVEVSLQLSPIRKSLVSIPEDQILDENHTKGVQAHESGVAGISKTSQRSVRSTRSNKSAKEKSMRNVQFVEAAVMCKMSNSPPDRIVIDDSSDEETLTNNNNHGKHSSVAEQRSADARIAAFQRAALKISSRKQVTDSEPDDHRQNETLLHSKNQSKRQVDSIRSPTKRTRTPQSHLAAIKEDSRIINSVHKNTQKTQTDEPLRTRNQSKKHADLSPVERNRTPQMHVQSLTQQSRIISSIHKSTQKSPIRSRTTRELENVSKSSNTRRQEIIPNIRDQGTSPILNRDRSYQNQHISLRSKDVNLSPHRPRSRAQCNASRYVEQSPKNQTRLGQQTITYGGEMEFTHNAAYSERKAHKTVYPSDIESPENMRSRKESGYASPPKKRTRNESVPDNIEYNVRKGTCKSHRTYGNLSKAPDKSMESSILYQDIPRQNKTNKLARRSDKDVEQTDSFGTAFDEIEKRARMTYLKGLSTLQRQDKFLNVTDKIPNLSDTLQSVHVEDTLRMPNLHYTAERKRLTRKPTTKNFSPKIIFSEYETQTPNLESVRTLDGHDVRKKLFDQQSEHLSSDESEIHGISPLGKQKIANTTSEIINVHKPKEPRKTTTSRKLEGIINGLVKKCNQREQEPHYRTTSVKKTVQDSFEDSDEEFLPPKFKLKSQMQSKNKQLNDNQKYERKRSIRLRANESERSYKRIYNERYSEDEHDEEGSHQQYATNTNAEQFEDPRLPSRRYKETAMETGNESDEVIDFRNIEEVERCLRSPTKHKRLSISDVEVRSDIDIRDIHENIRSFRGSRIIRTLLDLSDHGTDESDQDIPPERPESPSNAENEIILVEDSGKGSSDYTKEIVSSKRLRKTKSPYAKKETPPAQTLSKMMRKNDSFPKPLEKSNAQINLTPASSRKQSKSSNATNDNIKAITDENEQSRTVLSPRRGSLRQNSILSRTSNKTDLGQNYDSQEEEQPVDMPNQSIQNHSKLRSSKKNNSRVLTSPPEKDQSLNNTNQINVSQNRSVSNRNLKNDTQIHEESISHKVKTPTRASGRKSSQSRQSNQQDIDVVSDAQSPPRSSQKDEEIFAKPIPPPRRKKLQKSLVTEVTTKVETPKKITQEIASEQAKTPPKAKATRGRPKTIKAKTTKAKKPKKSPVRDFDNCSVTSSLDSTTGLRRSNRDKKREDLIIKLKEKIKTKRDLETYGYLIPDNITTSEILGGDSPYVKVKPPLKEKPAKSRTKNKTSARGKIPQEIENNPVHQPTSTTDSDEQHNNRTNLEEDPASGDAPIFKKPVSKRGRKKSALKNTSNLISTTAEIHEAPTFNPNETQSRSNLRSLELEDGIDVLPESSREHNNDTITNADINDNEQPLGEDNIEQSSRRITRSNSSLRVTSSITETTTGKGARKKNPPKDTSRILGQDLTNLNTTNKSVASDDSSLILVQQNGRSIKSPWTSQSLSFTKKGDLSYTNALKGIGSNNYSGYIRMDVNCSKADKRSAAALIFTILEGKCSIKVQNNLVTLGEKEFFMVPRGESYEIKNIGKTALLLQFTYS